MLYKQTCQEKKNSADIWNIMSNNNLPSRLIDRLSEIFCNDNAKYIWSWSTILNVLSDKSEQFSIVKKHLHWIHTPELTVYQKDKKILWQLCARPPTPLFPTELMQAENIFNPKNCSLFLGTISSNISSCFAHW